MIHPEVSTVKRWIKLKLKLVDLVLRMSVKRIRNVTCHFTAFLFHRSSWVVCSLIRCDVVLFFVVVIFCVTPNCNSAVQCC